MEDKLDERLLEKVDEKIEHVLDEDINTTNLEHLYKLRKIKHVIKEDECMNYGNYGGYGNYGNYGGYQPDRGSYGRETSYGREHYGRRGYDAKYRGFEHLERMSDNYGRYEENKSRYGAGEDTQRSLRYMLESMEDFARMLKEEAKSQEEVQMIRETAQRIANM